MTLSLMLRQQIRSSLNDDNGPWRQFILDHLDYIKARTSKQQITPELMAMYRYDLERFLVDRMYTRGDITWIVQRLNNLANDFEFVDIVDIYIPPVDVIMGLYSTHMAVQNNITEA